jgi:hypothetical protein
MAIILVYCLTYVATWTCYGAKPGGKCDGYNNLANYIVLMNNFAI